MKLAIENRNDASPIQAVLLQLGYELAASELRECRLGATSFQALAHFRRKQKLGSAPGVDPEIVGELWKALAAKKIDTPFLVLGTIHHPNGKPLVKGKVIAFDRDLRGEQPLDEATTDAEGRYRIAYGPKAFARAEKQHADLVIQVLQCTTELYKSGIDEVVFNAPAVTVIDIQLEKGDTHRDSEFETIRKALQPLLGGAKVEELEETQKKPDITFLNHETGIAFNALEHFVLAHKMAKSGIDADFFFALLRRNALLGSAASSPLRFRIRIGINNEVDPLLHDVALLDRKLVESEVNEAIRLNVVDADLAKRVPPTIKTLKGMRAAAKSYYKTEFPRMVAGLIAGNLVNGRHNEVLKAILENQRAGLGPVLEKLAGIAVDDGAKVDTQTKLELAQVLGYDGLLIEKIRGARGIRAPKDVRELAKLDEGEWKKTLEAIAPEMAKEGVKLDPASFDRHAATLMRRTEAQFPTAAFHAQLDRDAKSKIAGRKGMLELLKNHPEFELASTNVNVFFKKNAIAFPVGAVEADVKREIRKVQRVFKLAPSYRKTTALLDANVHSCQAIAAMGESRFVRFADNSGEFTKLEAQKVYRKAKDIHTATALFAGDLSSAVRASDVSALSAPPGTGRLDAVTGEFPNLKSLFQLTDSCECKECRSIYGPAAYLVDTLRFLSHREVRDQAGVPQGSAKDALFSRRADLGEIDLNCENALTPLPYIDVACELLEDAVALERIDYNDAGLAAGPIPNALLTTLQNKGFPVTAAAKILAADGAGVYLLRDKNLVCKIEPNGPAKWKVRRLRQTYLTAEQLDAAPEYVNQAAYAELTAKKFAFILPFDLHNEEARGCFEQFKVGRVDLMRTLRDAAGPADHEIGAEALGMSDYERAVIVTPDPGNPASYWNAGAAVLQNVDKFLTRSGLTFAGLEELLRQSTVNIAPKLAISNPSLACDTANMTLTNLDGAALDRIHRFMRLQRKLGWSMADVNCVIEYPRLGNKTLDNTCIARLGDAVRVKDKLKLEVHDLLSFYGEIPRNAEEVPERPRSPYWHLFLDESALGKIEPQFVPATVAANPALVTPAKIADFAESLAAAFGIKAEDTARLAAHLGANQPVSFANLAAVYARMRLAQGLGLSTEDCLAFEKLSAIDPLASPTKTLEFIDKATTLKELGIPVATLSFLLTDQATDRDYRVLTDARVKEFLEKVQMGLIAAERDNKSPFDAQLSVGENRDKLKETLNKLSGVTEADAATYLKIVDLIQWPLPADTALAGAFIDNTFGFLGSTADVKQKQVDLANAPAAGQEAARALLIDSTLKMISDSQRASAKKSAVEKQVVASWRLDGEVAKAILQGARLKQPAGGATPLLTDILVADALLNAAPVAPGPALTNQYRATRLLNKLAPVVATMGLDAEGMKFLLASSQALGWAELDSTPYEAGQAPLTFAAWDHLAESVRLWKDLKRAENPDNPDLPITFFSVIALTLVAATPVNDVYQLLSRLSGWNETLLKDLGARFGFTLAGLQKPASHRKLRDAVELLQQRLGVDVATAAKFIPAKLDAAGSDLIRGALKARYDDLIWLTVLKAIQNDLRNKKRDALVAYLLGTNRAFKSSADLFDHFLIDVDMCACQPTSRLVQAHSTVQLFVHRCLSGLEPKAVADTTLDRDWDQWTYLESFRKAQVGKEIFLYPEEILADTPRDNKSFMFKELEATLAQGELTDEAAENAAIEYLEKLDDLAFLEVVGTYYDETMYRHHVFARTKGGDPASYYYRRWEKEREWTPWEKVELDIASDHLVAFVRNARLYLAWAVITEEPADRQPVNMPTQGPGEEVEKTWKQWKVQLAISEHTGRKWLPRKLSADALVTSYPYVTLPSKAGFRLTVHDAGRFGFWIACTLVENGLYIGLNRSQNSGWTRILGFFNLAGCKGYPEPVSIDDVSLLSWFEPKFLPRFKDTAAWNQRLRESSPRTLNDLAGFALPNLQKALSIFLNTPGTFRLTLSQQWGLIDKLFFIVEFFLIFKSEAMRAQIRKDGLLVPLGSFMPFFYEDGDRNFVAIPGFREDPALGATERTFTDILRFVQDMITLVTNYVAKLQASGDLAAVLAELLADPELERLKAEMALYRSLPYNLAVKPFYHPLVCKMRTTLYRDGLPALMRRETQLQKTGFNFQSNMAFNPTSAVFPVYPVEDIDFSMGGAMAYANWETFYHLPMFMASRLGAAQNFEKARKWLQFIFDPTGALLGDVPKKYWVTRPFYDRPASDYVAQRIDSLMLAIAVDPSGSTLAELKYAVEQWRARPYHPHSIARSRTVAYQKSTALKYIDNLIAWGDMLFRQPPFGWSEIEAMNVANQLYATAERLLGPKPRVIPEQAKPEVKNFDQIEADIDLFGNALVDIENMIPDLGLPTTSEETFPSPPDISTLYFCIPHDPKLLERWETIEDRRYKIHHCQTIDGVERRMALFAPRIDPALAARLAAAGVGLGALAAGFGAPLPNYRFTFMAQKATELAQEVRTLGSSLLQAMEKRDAEGIAMLRSEHEIKVLNLALAIKEKQVQEAGQQIAALQASIDLAKEKKKYYGSRAPVSVGEAVALALTAGALIPQEIALGLNVAAGAIHLAPNLQFGASGAGGSPHVTVQYGSNNFTGALSSFAGAASTAAGMLQTGAGIATTVAGYIRRKEEWDFQGGLAVKEIAQIEKQKLAAEIRRDIATRDLENQKNQIESLRRIDEYMRSKFSNKELYDWMVGQISVVYFQAYELAFQVALKSQRCFQYETGTEVMFLDFGYWDGLRKGLQTADRLLHDIKRMEVAFLDRPREQEMVKHISLALLDPYELQRLRETGKCNVRLPEAIFDLDQPGQYRRRIKTVSISIPCVAGPYTSVSCKLRLLENKYRNNTTNAAAYDEAGPPDPRFVYGAATVQSVALSHSQNDSGMFEMNFRDEKYLPFEGAGAISTWQIELPTQIKQFDYWTISDVVMHIRYTAREGPESFKNQVNAILLAALNKIKADGGRVGLFVAYDIKREMPEEWHVLGRDKTVDLTIEKQALPYFGQVSNPSIESAQWLGRIKNNPAIFPVSLDGTAFNFVAQPGFGNLRGQASPTIVLDTPFTLAAANAQDLEELALLVKYKLN